jgi:hypothetical protein
MPTLVAGSYHAGQILVAEVPPPQLLPAGAGKEEVGVAARQEAVPFGLEAAKRLLRAVQLDSPAVVAPE